MVNTLLWLPNQRALGDETSSYFVAREVCSRLCLIVRLDRKHRLKHSLVEKKSSVLESRLSSVDMELCHRNKLVDCVF